MYTYKRNLRSYPKSTKRKRAGLMIKDRTFYLRAALYICIAAMLAVSLLFINSAAAWAMYKKQIAFFPEGQPEQDSGSDDEFQDDIIDPKLILSQEIPVIYGVDLKRVDLDEDKDFNADIYFKLLPEDIKLEIIRISGEPMDFHVGADGPQILIYHTHTEEAYRQVPGAEYADTGNCHTKDQSQSIVMVGEELKDALTDYGFNVIHDTTDHQSSNSYSKSLKTLDEYKQKYPTLKIYIDIHRDSSSDQSDYVTIKGKECARAMFVVGTSDKPGEKEKFESNYKLALAVTNELENIRRGSTRPIRIQNSSKHYNQLISDMCLLIEVGHNANSLEQAENAARYIALALSRVVEISGQ